MNSKLSACLRSARLVRGKERARRLAIMAVAGLGIAACAPDETMAPVDGLDAVPVDSDTAVADVPHVDTAVRDTHNADVESWQCSDPFIANPAPASEPPYSGTAFVSADIITETDPTAFKDVTYEGQESHEVYDRRIEGWATMDVHVFAASFGTEKVIPFWVNPEFDVETAESKARVHAAAVGRIPGFLAGELDSVVIHKGNNPFGGGGRSLLVHVEQGVTYMNTGVLEEILIHEATHAVMDAAHAATPRWLAAQEADGVAISTYARDNPTREDLAETLGLYLPMRFAPERLTPEIRETVGETIAARMDYLDCLGLDMSLVP